MAMVGVEVWVTALAVVGVMVAAVVARKYVWEPLRLGRIMAAQGVRGPPYRFLFGNILELLAFSRSLPDVMPLDDTRYNQCARIRPQHALYSPQYGKRYMFWWGPYPRLVVQEPEFVKQVLSAKNASIFTKGAIERSILGEIMGHGAILVVQGDEWALQRRTLKPFFHMEELKGMVEAMVKGAAPGLHKWELVVAEAGGSTEINVVPDLNAIAGNVLSHTAFSSDNDKGQEVAELQRDYVADLFTLVRSPLFWIPGARLLPTRANRRMAQTRSKIHGLLYEIMKDRREAEGMGKAMSYGRDLLGLMLAAACADADETSQWFNLETVFNNCKTFYFAGQETSATFLAFTLFLLARHPEWQDRARQEVLQVIGDPEAFDAAALSRLKIVEMVFNESHRLFPVTPFVSRVAAKDVEIEDLFIPKGMGVELATQAMHYDPEIWGADADTFNPARFSNGISKACTHPQAFIPFSTGPRNCLGKDFAMLEAKIVLSMALRRFEFSPSPNYKHCLNQGVVQAPKYGMPLIVKALEHLQRKPSKEAAHSSLLCE